MNTHEFAPKLFLNGDPLVDYEMFMRKYNMYWRVIDLEQFPFQGVRDP